MGRALSVTVILIALAALVGACGSDDGSSPASNAPPPSSQQAELQHIHGLGVDSGSGTLYVATHSGLFQAARDDAQLERLGDSRQDIMGFSVVGPGRFVGSGHPAPSQNLPPNLGLIESRNGGRSWENISLLGKADFHVLRSAGATVYGVDGGSHLMVSRDGGRTWRSRTPPAGVFDLAVDPGDAERIVISTERGVFSSPNVGKEWRPLRKDLAGLLAWPAPGRLYLVDGQGQVSRSADSGREFEAVGDIGGPPAAFIGERDALHVALTDGNVKRSADGGATWMLRATP